MYMFIVILSMYSYFDHKYVVMSCGRKGHLDRRGKSDTGCINTRDSFRLTVGRTPTYTMLPPLPCHSPPSLSISQLHKIDGLSTELLRNKAQ